jgi:phage-related protein
MLLSLIVVGVLVSTVLGGVFDDIGNFFGGVADDVWSAIKGAVGNAIDRALSWVWDGIWNVWSWLSGFVDEVTGWVANAVNQAWAWVQDAITAAWNFAQSVANEAWGWVQGVWGWIESVGAWLVGVANSIGAWIQQAVNNVTDWVLARILELWHGVIEPALGVLHDAIGFAVTQVTSLICAVDHLVQIVSQKLEGLLAYVANDVVKIVNVCLKAFEWLVYFATHPFSFFTDLFKELFDKGSEWTMAQVVGLIRKEGDQLEKHLAEWLSLTVLVGLVVALVFPARSRSTDA